jgi:transposase-like protein
MEVDPRCLCWVQVYAPELNRRLPATSEADQSYRTEETYIKVRGEEKYRYWAGDSTGQPIEFRLTAK